jgi:hypothetical protein
MVDIISSLASAAAAGVWYRVPGAKEGPLTGGFYRYRSGNWAIDVLYEYDSYEGRDLPVYVSIVDWPRGADRAAARRKVREMLQRIIDQSESA